MAETRTVDHGSLLNRRVPIVPTAARRALTVAATIVIAALIVSSGSFDPLPMAIVASGLVAVGFAVGAYAWWYRAPHDSAGPTAWDYSGLLLFAGFALATALGSSWMTP